MIHDHLCPHVQVAHQRDHVACQCILIAKVRKDAELAAWQDVYEKIHDGFRGNGSEDWNICCQLCQEIQCDGDCPVGEARRREREAAKQALAVAVQRVEALRQASARSSTRSVRSEEAAISEHLPECPMADPSPARRSHCLCDRLRQAEQRGRDDYIKSLPAFHAYREGQRDERDRIRRFVLGLTTTEHTRHLVDTILWHIDKGDSDE